MANLEKDFDLEESFDKEPERAAKSKGVLETLGNKLSNLPGQAVDAVKSVLPSAETVEDTATGGLQGMTLGHADEGEGAIRALAEATTSGKGGSDIAELYRKYQLLAQKRAEDAKARSPYAYMAGELGGGLVTGLATAGAGLGIGAAGTGVAEAAGLAGTGVAEAAGLAGTSVAKEIGKRALASAGTGALLGGITGAGTSKGNLGSQEQIADTLGSAAMGGVLGGGLTAAGEVAGLGANKLKGIVGEYVQDSPLLRQFNKARQMGKSGTVINEGEKAGNTIAQEQISDIGGITNKLKAAKDTMGKEIQAAVDSATADGTKIDITPELSEVTSDLRQALSENKLAFGTSEADKVIAKLTKLGSGELNPSEARTLKQQLYEMVNTIDAPEIRNPMSRFQKGIDGALNEAVPGLEKLNTKYSTFLSSAPEVLLSQGQPTEIVNKFLSSLKNPDANVSEAVTELLSTLSAPGAQKQVSRRIYSQLMDKLNTFEQANPGLLTKLGIGTPEEFGKELLDKADKFAISRQILGYDPHGSPLKHLMAGAVGTSTTGRGYVLSGANLLGKTESAIAKSGPARLSRNLYQAGDDVLTGTVDTLANSGIPGIDSLASALKKGIENKNQAMKNAALFTILQNPKARLLISSEDLNSEEQPKEPLKVDVFNQK